MVKLLWEQPWCIHFLWFDLSHLRSRLRFQALQTQKLNPQKSVFYQLVLRLTDQITATTVQLQTHTALPPLIRVNQIIKLTKDGYLEHLTNQTKTQN